MSLAGKVEAVDLHEGDWETPGSIKLWKYIIDGKTEIFKERVLNKDEGGLVKLSLEYEKHKATDEPPYQYLDFVAGLIKDIDAHLVKAA
ncbi:hypothetical protein ACOSQ2_019878 [Xanthoceras sorbifolium]